eukprot:TRINITY_DN49770_c0_g3_i1.p1 TRINITY_DN49770_c0_g3~~TRINITY_DN49770_c0_g3_i1.p1  ORF type:complete len:73 (-),score=15.11 TRINITY_DN49770_c0_g3_i1:57-275(-)
MSSIEEIEMMIGEEKLNEIKQTVMADFRSKIFIFLGSVFAIRFLPLGLQYLADVFDFYPVKEITYSALENIE